MDNVNGTENTNLGNDMVHKDRVTELVKQAKLDGMTKGRLEAEALLQERQQQAPQNMGGVSGPTSEEIDKMLEQKLQEKLEAQYHKQQEDYRRHQATEVAQTFFSRLDTGKEKYKDWDEFTGDFDINAYPSLVGLMTGFENTADIFYELAKNPAKLQQVDYFSRIDPRAAQSQLKRISESIKANQQAQDNQIPVNAPLSRVSPSPNAGADAGQMQVRDLKKLRSLRG